jgi:hypothetical protein
LAAKCVGTYITVVIFSKLLLPTGSYSAAKACPEKRKQRSKCAVKFKLLQFLYRRSKSRLAASGCVQKARIWQSLDKMVGLAFMELKSKYTYRYVYNNATSVENVMSVLAGHLLHTLRFGGEI